MISYELKTQQTDKDIERRRVDYLSRDFRTELKDREKQHTLYAFTMTAKEKHIREGVGWFDLDARQTFVETLFFKLLHRVSARCCANYKRNIHKDKRLIPFYSVEHHSKKTGNLVSPHIHATIAVSPEWDDKFMSCFERKVCKEHYELRNDLIERWSVKLGETELIHIPDNANLYNWMGYSTKQIDPDFNQYIERLSRIKEKENVVSYR
jgi:hypothetical protein